ALNLILDFDFIESGAAAGSPKYMEWYGAFGLMVTLISLYLEILRLLAKSRSRRSPVRARRPPPLPWRRHAIAPPVPGKPPPLRHGAERPTRGAPPASPRRRSPPGPPGRGSRRTDAAAAPARPRGGPPSHAPPRAPPRPTAPPARRRWV